MTKRRGKSAVGISALALLIDRLASRLAERKDRNLNAAKQATLQAKGSAQQLPYAWLLSDRDPGAEVHGNANAAALHRLRRMAMMEQHFDVRIAVSDIVVLQSS